MPYLTNMRRAPLLIIGFTTFEPVLSSTVSSDHTLLSGQLSKADNYFPQLMKILTCIERSRSPNELSLEIPSIVLEKLGGGFF